MNEENRKPKYAQGMVYKALVEILEMAGFEITYQNVPNDPIDGAIWARSDEFGRIIMPEEDEAFPDEETACLILGHEAGHALSHRDSPDIPSIRRANEAVCDLIGCYLYELALRVYEKKMKTLFDAQLKQ